MMANGWHVTNQHQTSELTPAGTFQDVMEVTAISDTTGSPVTVRVPLSAYTADNVKRLLDDRFAVVHDVHGL